MNKFQATLVALGSAAVLSIGPDPKFSFLGYLSAIYAAYIPTQGPIAVGEMFLTGLILSHIYKQRPDVLSSLKVIPRSAAILLIASFLIFPQSSLVFAGQKEVQDQNVTETDKAMTTAQLEAFSMTA